MDYGKRSDSKDSRGGGQNNLSSLTGIGRGLQTDWKSKASIVNLFGLQRKDGSLLPAGFFQQCGDAGKKAFTLAEVLITLGIIGIVAAMTLPALVGNYKKKQTVTQLQKVYTVLNQALRQSEADNESSLYWDTSKGTQAYFTEYWKPYLKIIKYCTEAGGPEECNYTSRTPWYRADGRRDAYNVAIDSNRVASILSDGTFVSILTSSGYGSQEGSSDENGNIIGNTGGIDSRIIVDLNASKMPNTFGRDVFLLQRVAGKGVMPYGYNEDDDTVDENCSKNGSGFMCAAKLMRSGWDMEDDYPW